MANDPLSAVDTNNTSHSLLRRVRSHDAEAWRRLVDLYSPLVAYWCRRSSLSPEDSDDVTQDVFRAVATGIGGFRHAKPEDTFRGWLRTVFKSKMVNFVNGNKHQPTSPGGTAALEWMQQVPEGEVDDGDERQVVSDLYRQAMTLIQTEFEETTWQAFWLMTVEDRSAKDAAAELGLTVGAAHTARWRVLRRLRQELGDVE